MKKLLIIFVWILGCESNDNLTVSNKPDSTFVDTNFAVGDTIVVQMSEEPESWADGVVKAKSESGRYLISSPLIEKWYGDSTRWYSKGRIERKIR